MRKLTRLGLLGCALVVGGGLMGAASPAKKEPLSVSMVQLLANPERFEGKAVRLIGFCVWGFESQAIYFHTEDADVGNPANALWIESSPGPPPTNVHRKFVLVEGVFTAKNRGHIGAYSGTLRDVSRLLVLPPLSETRSLK